MWTSRNQQRFRRYLLFLHSKQIRNKTFIGRISKTQCPLYRFSAQGNCNGMYQQVEVLGDKAAVLGVTTKETPYALQILVTQFNGVHKYGGKRCPRNVSKCLSDHTASHLKRQSA